MREREKKRAIATTTARGPIRYKPESAEDKKPDDGSMTKKRKRKRQEIRDSLPPSTACVAAAIRGKGEGGIQYKREKEEEEEEGKRGKTGTKKKTTTNTKRMEKSRGEENWCFP